MRFDLPLEFGDSNFSSLILRRAHSRCGWNSGFRLSVCCQVFISHRSNIIFNISYIIFNIVSYIVSYMINMIFNIKYIYIYIMFHSSTIYILYEIIWSYKNIIQHLPISSNIWFHNSFPSSKRLPRDHGGPSHRSRSGQRPYHPAGRCHRRRPHWRSRPVLHCWGRQGRQGSWLDAPKKWNLTFKTVGWS